MKLTVTLFGQLKRLLKDHPAECDCPEGASPAEALEVFFADCDPEARAIVFDAGRRLRPSLIVLVNGQPVSKETPRPLKDGDQITLLTAIAGG